MNDIILAFKVVFPILVYVGIGYILKIAKLYKEQSINDLNSLVFNIFLPCLLFYNIYVTEIQSILNVQYILFSIIAVLVIFILLMATVPLFIKDKPKCGVFIQGIFRSNFALFGLPVTLSLLGEGNGGLTSLAIAFIVPLYNILAVICLEIFRKNKINFANILKGVVKNPLIIASALGLIFLFAKISLPDICVNIVRDLSRVATPLALIGLGSSFTFSAAKSNLKLLIVIMSLKLIIIPVVVIGIASFVFGFNGAAIVAIISMFASPTAVSSFTMAQSMGGDSELAAGTVVFTSVFSILTVFVIIAVSKYLGLF